MKDTSLKIVLDKDIYESDDFITGHVSMKSRVPLFIKKICLNFTKNRKMDVCKIESPGGPKGVRLSKKNVEYSYDFELYNSNGTSEEISSGSHFFPFKFCLKNIDSSTCEIKGIYFDYLVNIINSYCLTSSVFLIGAYEPILLTNKEVQIAETQNKTDYFQTKIEMSTIMCLLYRTYTIRFHLNKKVFFSGDQLCLDIHLEKSLSKQIKNVECNLYEVLTVQTPELNFIRTKYVVGGNAVLDKKNYSMNLRIPSNTPTCANEDSFSLKILMFINMSFANSSPIRIKKYLHVVKRKNSLPDLEYIDVLEGERFEEKFFILD
ncbi:hypothetical protein P3W45_000483 [Vairimorpha bombi]|jgi:hypothetical protein